MNTATAILGAVKF